MNINKYLKETHYADIESIGFIDAIKNEKDIHCLCSITEDDKVILFHDKPELDNAVVWDKEDEKEYIMPKRAGSLLEGFRYWYKIGRNGGKLSVHNCATYDKPVIEKVIPQCKIPVSAWRDTYIQSKMQLFDRPCPKGAKSPHGLHAYGIKFGVKKPPITDFTRFDAYILHRVIEDCRIQKRTQLFLDDEARDLNKLGIDLSDAYDIEFEYAMGCQRQEQHGIKVDKEHIFRCISAWDERLEKLSDEIEPLLPPTVKVNSTKVTRSEMMKSLGYKKIPTDETEVVTRGGITKTQAKKPYYKPSVNYTKVIKTNNYSGFSVSCGESPTFLKRSELRSWIKNNTPDTKPYEWVIEKEIVEIAVLNKNTCDYFGVEETATDYIVGVHTRVSFVKSKMTQHEVVKGYLIKHSGLKHVVEWNFKRDSNKQIVRAKQAMVVSYPPKAAPEHQLHYKVKRGDPIVTSPALNEEDYDQLIGDIGYRIAEYNTTMHRRRYLSNPKDPENKGVLSYIREDGRIPAGVGNFMTASGRSNQRVIVNLPSESSFLGKEMRQILIADEGKELVGADQASAQLQICSFVTNNHEYYEAVAKGKELVKDKDGKDVYQGNSAHCFNARAFGIIKDEDRELCIKTQDKELMHKLSLQRKEAKSPAFAVLFGCAPAKVAGMLKCCIQEAKEKRQTFLSKMGLDPVQKWLEECSKKYKKGNGFYIPTAFGYWVFCKSQHKAVNYLIQSVEGATQKVACNRFDEINTNQEFYKVLDVHDEFLSECPKGMGDEVGKLMGSCYTYAGEQLTKWYKDNIDKYSGGDSVDITLDFNGGYAVGQSYDACH